MMKLIRITKARMTMQRKPAKLATQAFRSSGGNAQARDDFPKAKRDTWRVVFFKKLSDESYQTVPIQALAVARLMGSFSLRMGAETKG